MARLELAFVAIGNRVIAVTSSDANDSGFVKGALYRFTFVSTPGAALLEGGAVCRWGSSAATAADAGGDFVVQPAESVTVRAPGTTLHAIRVSAVDGTLIGSRVEE